MKIADEHTFAEIDRDDYVLLLNLSDVTQQSPLRLSGIAVAVWRAVREFGDLSYDQLRNALAIQPGQDDDLALSQVIEELSDLRLLSRSE